MTEWGNSTSGRCEAIGTATSTPNDIDVQNLRRRRCTTRLPRNSTSLSIQPVTSLQTRIEPKAATARPPRPADDVERMQGRHRSPALRMRARHARRDATRATNARCAVVLLPHAPRIARRKRAPVAHSLARVVCAFYKSDAASSLSSQTVPVRPASPRTHTHTMTTAATATSPPADIHALLPGLVLTPSDGAAYAAATRRWAANAERAARYIVQPRTAADVSKAVRPLSLMRLCLRADVRSDGRSRTRPHTGSSSRSRAAGTRARARPRPRAGSCSTSART
jgi:hypothetical protein